MIEESTTIILDKNQIRQKIRRIAFQIWESNMDEQEIVLAGIFDRGYHFAQALQKMLKSLCPIEVKLVKIEINKENPTADHVKLDIDPKLLSGKVLILVDDVLNTGKTVFYALQPFLQIEVKKIETAFLVNRSHKAFPVEANFTGLQLSTTIQDHIKVDFKKEIVFLT